MHEREKGEPPARETGASTWRTSSTSGPLYPSCLKPEAVQQSRIHAEAGNAAVSVPTALPLITTDRPGPGGSVLGGTQGAAPERGHVAQQERLETPVA